VTLGRRTSGALAAALALVATMAFASAASGADGPTVVPARTAAAPGARVLVDVVGWEPGSSATVVLCGNEARRGSQDCDLRHGQSVELYTADSKKVLLTVSLPPAPCPCVLRAYDVHSNVVITTPFEVIGAPTAPVVDGDAAVPRFIEVSARLREVRGSFTDRLRKILGGPVGRRLVLDVRNTSGGPLSGVTVSAALGRSAGHGEALEAPAPFDLAAGEHREVAVDVRIGAPSHGRYVVSGTTFAGGSAVPFSTGTSTTPVGLYILVLIVLVDLSVLIAIAVLRARDRLEDEPWEPDDGPSDRDPQDDREPRGSVPDDRQMAGANSW
jgi:hypothetical protein